ncbi:MAG TPA: DUF6603 domain-containing protein [Candidatus Angelobacter sp.]|nr:DUF6603 domain-containing protein [Candidatus Angelobacter sp.]
MENPEMFNSLLTELGLAAESPATAAIASALQAINDMVSQIEALTSTPSPSFDGIAHLLADAKQAVTALRSIESASGMAAALAGLGEELTQWLFGVYLFKHHPLAYRLGILFAFIETFDEATPTAPVMNGDETQRDAAIIPRFLPEKFLAFLRDPRAALTAAYLNGLATQDDANAMADKLFVRMSSVLNELNVPARYGANPQELAFLGDAAPFVDHSLTIYALQQFRGDPVDAGVTLSLSPATRGDLGLVVSPFGVLTLTMQGGKWALELDLTADIDAFAYGKQGFTIAASASTTQVNGKLSAMLAAPDSGPAFLFGAPNGSRLEVGGALLTATTSLTEAKQTLALSGEVSKSAIVISPGDGDGFLSSVLPKDGLQTKFDLGLAWSNNGGLSFKGAAGLDATLPVGVSIGDVIAIPAVHLALQTSNDAGLVAEVSISVSLMIGPVQAVADRIGITSNITFPQDGGNLGVADLTFAFKPPSGIGLAVDAAGVSGGGFLGRDDAKREYTGVLQLQFTDLALQAFGLITTQVAGAEGYSLLAMIDADFPPVQLGWGFTLNGVGGLLAVHRAASVDALHAALKAYKLGTILFPKNAITNAPQILAELDTLFPTAPGRFLFGPMALIGWGTPTVLTAALAIIIELPEPIRIVLLARLAVRLPSESDSLVRINMDALGVLDLGQDSLSLDATLFDSRLLKFALSGDMALRANWGGDPREFLLSVGGFHPRFTPPTGFPTLKRMSIDMSSGAIATLHLESYLAITSNTLQIGANLHVVVKVSAFSVDGHLGFDALFQRDPFHFDGDISGAVAVSIDGYDLLSVSLDASLTGPAPWNVAGSFKVHIVFVDVHKSFSHTWGDDAPADQIAAVDVAALLATTFADPRSWGAQLPDGTPALISARDVRSAGIVVAHPLARLEVHERTVPLGMDIVRVGGAPLAGANNFSITGFRIGGSMVPRESVQDDFASAEFLDMSDNDKLAQPSFERHDAGVRLTSGPTMIKFGAPVPKEITYETFFIDAPGSELRSEPGKPIHKWLLSDLQVVLGTGSAAQATMMRAGNRRYTAPGNPIQVAEPAFVLVDANTLAPTGIGPASGATYSDVRALLNQELNRVPAQQGHLQIVGTHEMVTPNA